MNLIGVRSFVLTAILAAAIGSGSFAPAQEDPDTPPHPEAPKSAPQSSAIEPPVLVEIPPSDSAEPGEARLSPDVPRNFEAAGENLPDALRRLARAANKALILTDGVVHSGGTVTFRIENKTPLETIQIIIDSKGLIYDEVDGVLTIRTAAERRREPFERAAPRWIKEMSEFKGSYYAELIKAGVPDETARQLVLSETFTSPATQTERTRPENPSGTRESPADQKSSWDDWGLSKLLAGLALVSAFLSRFPALLVHLLFGFAVLFRARRFEREGGSLVFLGPWSWSFATLLGGFLVAFGYWVIHHSRLKAARPNS